MSRILALIEGKWEEMWRGPSKYLSAEATACRADGYKIKTCLA